MATLAEINEKLKDTNYSIGHNSISDTIEQFDSGSGDGCYGFKTGDQAYLALMGYASVIGVINSKPLI